MLLQLNDYNNSSSFYYTVIDCLIFPGDDEEEKKKKKLDTELQIKERHIILRQAFSKAKF